MTSKGIARKAYIIITLVITLPLCAAFLYFSEQQKKIILMENDRELIRISATLAQHIPQNGKHIVFWSDKYIRDDLASETLMKFYQPYVDELATLYPHYEIGIYHRNLDGIIAMHPYSNPRIPLDSHVLNKLYETREAVTTIVNSGLGGMPVIVSVSPIYHLGSIAGYTWVSKKIDYILKESNDFLIKGIVFSICLWLLLMAIVRAVFRKLDNSLILFSNQIAEGRISSGEFQDFPQLEPLFDTIVILRKELKKETEHYLEENQKIKKLIELTPLVIFLVDNNGVIKDCNQAFLKVYPKTTRKTVINLPYKVLTDSSNRDYDDTVIVRALRGEEIRDEYDLCFNRCWINNAFPIKNNDGEIIGAIAICHDVTEHEKFRKDILRLDRLNIVGQMAASVAHEVRNPMTVVRGYIQSILLKTGNAYSVQFRTIIEELDRANRIISDFLSLARDQYVEKKNESLSQIIQDINPLIESEALVRNICCHMRLDENLPMLLLNSEEMKQLILNLSMNALDAMKDHGELILSCTHNHDTGEVVLAVSDTGSGIGQSDMERLFEPFYTTKKHGSGLGLPVCKSIVERHGGHIGIQSELGKGSVFTVSFPVRL